MADITVDLPTLFGSGQAGDEFYIETSGSTFGIVNQDGDKMSAITLAADGTISIARTENNRTISVFIDTTSNNDIKIINKQNDEEQYNVLVVNDTSILISTKTSGQQAHILKFD